MTPAAEGRLAWKRLDALSWDEAAAAFTACYEGYVIPVHASGADLAARALAEDIDASASWIASDADGAVGVGLIARRGGRSRVAAFAIAPRGRGRGVAAAALSRLVRQSRERGDASLELEVFEHNIAAVKLYQRFGFRRTDRLVGFELVPPLTDEAPHELPTVPTGRLIDALAAEPDPGLPWQLRPETLARLGGRWEAAGDPDGALAFIDLSRLDAVHLRLIFTPRALRRTGRAGALFHDICKVAAGRPVRVPQLVPERFVPFGRALGMEIAQYAQLRMALVHR